MSLVLENASEFKHILRIFNTNIDVSQLKIHFFALWMALYCINQDLGSEVIK